MKRLFHCLLLIGLLAGLSGCEIRGGDYPPDEGTATWQLCNRMWEGLYTEPDGTQVDHQIIFYPDGTGEESLLYSYYGDAWEEYYDFRWFWANSVPNSIALDYRGGGRLYMDHVYIDRDYFSCLLNGTYVTFRGY